MRLIGRQLPFRRKLHHLISIKDLNRKQLTHLVDRAAYHKQRAKKDGGSHHHVEKKMGLAGQSIAMMFNKRSTRTRVSTEAAVSYFGGNSMFLGKDDIQLGV